MSSNYNALFIFECVLRDHTFMKSIDDYITSTIGETKTFDVKNVPRMVLIIMNLLSTHTIYSDVRTHIKNDTELQELLCYFYDYILRIINGKVNSTEFNIADFKNSFDICCRLAIMKLKLKNQSGFFCVGK